MRTALFSLVAFGCSLMLYTPAAGIVGDASPADSSLARYAVMVTTDRTLCSGIVLAQNLVLTAAHCVFDTSKVSVVFSGSTAANAIEIVVHPRFNTVKNSSADLALLKISELLPSRFASAYLAAQPARVDDHLTVVGFGMAVDGNKDSAGTARMAMLTVVSARFNSPLVLTAINGSREASCGGDSGGPVFATRSGVPSLVGVVMAGNEDFWSNSSRCGGNTFVVPILSYREWIVETADKLGSSLGR